MQEKFSEALSFANTDESEVPKKQKEKIFERTQHNSSKTKLDGFLK